MFGQVSSTGSHIWSKVSCRSFWKMFNNVGLSEHSCFTSVAEFPFDIPWYVLML